MRGERRRTDCRRRERNATQSHQPMNRCGKKVRLASVTNSCHCLARMQGTVWSHKRENPCRGLIMDQDGTVSSGESDALDNRKLLSLVKKLVRGGTLKERTEAAAALGGLGWTPLTPREEAAYLVAMGEWQKAIRLGWYAAQELRKLLGEQSSELRRKAVKTLGKIGDRTATRSLAGALKDPNRAIRIMAAEILGKRGHLEAVQPLAEAMSTETGRLYSDLRRQMSKILESIEVPREVLEEVRSMAPAFISDQMADQGRWNTGLHHSASVALMRLCPELRGLAAPQLSALFALRPEWAHGLPAKEKLQELAESVRWLPPIGGKIPLVIEGLPLFELPPSWTAEEQTLLLVELRREGFLGTIGYVHQLTIQGRLPDPFKAVALALILASPYDHDWQEPFFEAPWGKIAPLIHDGGSPNVSINPAWHSMKGRTDFLQRLAQVHQCNLETLESMKDEEQLAVFSHDVELLERYDREKAERSRLLLETRAYQRLALALHSDLGTMPADMPPPLRWRLVARWKLFTEHFTRLLASIGAASALRTPWFTNSPRQIEWLEERHEAPWPAICRDLIKLEELRTRHPEIRIAAIHLLAQATEWVDQELGLAR